MTNAVISNVRPASKFSAALWRVIGGKGTGVDQGRGNGSERFLPVIDSKPLGRAVVDTVKDQGKQWRVWHAATYWSAKAAEPGLEFFPEDIVQVVGRCGTLLLIGPGR